MMEKTPFYLNLKKTSVILVKKRNHTKTPTCLYIYSLFSHNGITLRSREYSSK